MSYYEQAKGINRDLKDLLNRVSLDHFTKNQREMLLNIFCRFGQVAKFRCRSNIAYDNFVNSCFEGLAIAKRVKSNENSDWETLRAFIKEEMEVKV